MNKALRYDIPTSKVATVTKRAKRLRERNAPHGLAQPDVEVVGVFNRDIEIRDHLAALRGSASDTRVVSVPMSTIELRGFEAEIAGFRVAGHRVVRRRLHAEEVVTFGDVPPGFDDRPFRCEHCETSRKRALTHVVVRIDDPNHVVQVGSSCLADFIGGDVPARLVSGLAARAGLLAEVARMDADGAAIDDPDANDDVETVLAVASSLVQSEGFVSSRAANPGEMPTWMRVLEEVRRYRNPDLPPGEVSVTLADMVSAGQIIEWVETTERDGDFMDAARRVIRDGISGKRDVAVLTALADAHRREIERSAEAGRDGEIIRRSRPIGIEGARQEFACAVVSVREFRGRFAVGDAITMADEDGNLAVWFASNRRHGLRPGMGYLVEGRVKRHSKATAGRFEGARQTIVTNVKVKRELGPMEPFPRADEPSAQDDPLLGLLREMRPGRM